MLNTYLAGRVYRYTTNNTLYALNPNFQLHFGYMKLINFCFRFFSFLFCSFCCCCCCQKIATKVESNYFQTQRSADEAWNAVARAAKRAPRCCCCFIVDRAAPWLECDWCCWCCCCCCCCSTKLGVELHFHFCFSLSRLFPFFLLCCSYFSPIAYAVCLWPSLLLHLHLFLVLERAGVAGCRCMYVCASICFALNMCACVLIHFLFVFHLLILLSLGTHYCSLLYAPYSQFTYIVHARYVQFLLFFKAKNKCTMRALLLACTCTRYL